METLEVQWWLHLVSRARGDNPYRQLSMPVRLNSYLPFCRRLSADGRLKEFVRLKVCANELAGAGTGVIECRSDGGQGAGLEPKAL